MAKNDDIYYPPTSSKKSVSTTAKSDVTMAAAAQASTASVTGLPPTNVMALVGFILSVTGFFTFVTAIPGVVLGHIALRQIRVTGESGHGLAVAALAVGYSLIGLSILAVALVVLIVLVPLLTVGSAALNGYYY